MATVPIQPGEDNFVVEDASDPRVQARPGGIGGRVQVRITVRLATGQGLAGSGGGLAGAISATNLVFHLIPLEAARLREELSKALGDLGT